MTSYLLDSNIISDLVRNPQGKVAKRIAKVGEDNVCTSIIVASELRYGCAKGRSNSLLRGNSDFGRALYQGLKTHFKLTRNMSYISRLIIAVSCHADS